MKKNKSLTIFLMLWLTLIFAGNSFASCKDDIRDHCYDVYANDGDVLGCLNAANSRLKSNCRENVDSINDAWREMIANCREERVKYCDKSTSRRPKPFPDCLMENKRGAYQACRKKIQAYEWSLKTITGLAIKPKVAPFPVNKSDRSINDCLQLLALLPVMSHAGMKSHVADWQKSGNYDLPGLVEKIETLSKAGRGDASYSMGALLQSGYCVARDDKMAMRYYQKAADQGNEQAKRIVNSISK